MLSAHAKSSLKDGMQPHHAGADEIVGAIDASTQNLRPVATGADLMNTATQTLASPSNLWETLGALGQNGALTLGVVNAQAGDWFELTRTDTSAFTYTVINGGTGGGNLAVLPVSKKASLRAQFDGTNWILRSIGTL